MFKRHKINGLSNIKNFCTLMASILLSFYCRHKRETKEHLFACSFVFQKMYNFTYQIYFN